MQSLFHTTWRGHLQADMLCVHWSAESFEACWQYLAIAPKHDVLHSLSQVESYNSNCNGLGVTLPLCSFTDQTQRMSI